MFYVSIYANDVIPVNSDSVNAPRINLCEGLGLFLDSTVLVDHPSDQPLTSVGEAESKGQSSASCADYCPARRSSTTQKEATYA